MLNFKNVFGLLCFSPFYFVCMPRRRHTSNTSSYSVLSKNKQLFVFFAVTDMQKRICRVSVPVGSIIPCFDSSHFPELLNTVYINVLPDCNSMKIMLV